MKQNSEISIKRKRISKRKKCFMDFHTKWLYLGITSFHRFLPRANHCVSFILKRISLQSSYYIFILLSSLIWPCVGPRLLLWVHFSMKIILTELMTSCMMAKLDFDWALSFRMYNVMNVRTSWSRKMLCSSSLSEIYACDRLGMIERLWWTDVTIAKCDEIARVDIAELTPEIAKMSFVGGRCEVVDVFRRSTGRLWSRKVTPPGEVGYDPWSMLVPHHQAWF